MILQMYSHLPLSKRIVRTQSKPLNILPPTGPRGTYRGWGEVNLVNAMMAIDKGVSLRRAAEMYKIPRSTLHDHVSGKIAFGARSGPDPYLLVEEEEELASFLMQSAKIGYPHTKKQVLLLVQQIITEKGIDANVSNGWWERFCQRHPSITLRAAVPFSLARAMATDSEVLNKYFDMLEECLQHNKIFDTPGQIFNCDETGLPLNPMCLKVVDKVGSKNPSFITSGDKSQLTVLACCSAAGYAIPPFVIFDRKALNPKLTEGEVPGTLYGLSHNGWINSELFFHWFLRHFLDFAPPTRPLMLLLDGHSSHYCPATIKLAAENRIIIFALPPHTTHIAQPLDRGCFAPLKVAWRQVCHEFCAKNPGRTVTRFEFSHLFAKAWYKAMTAPNIIASFKATGVCPFNRSAINVPGMEETSFSLFRPESLAQRTGLAYIPLYTPCRTRSSSCQNPVTTSHQSPFYLEPCPQKKFVLDVSLSESSHEQSFETSFHSSVPLRRATSVSNFLIPPLPPNKAPTKHGKSSGCVLTSQENIQRINEKERQKLEELHKKEERKLEREKKAQLKLQKKEEKTLEREKKTKLKQELAKQKQMEAKRCMLLVHIVITRVHYFLSALITYLEIIYSMYSQCSVEKRKKVTFGARMLAMTEDDSDDFSSGKLYCDGEEYILCVCIGLQKIKN